MVLSPEEEERLQSLAGSRTASLREVQRAKILLNFRAGQSFRELSRPLGISRRIVYKPGDRALAAGVAVARCDRPQGAAPTSTPEAQAWGGALACTKPQDPGQAAELWTRSALAQPIRREAQAAGPPSLAHAAKSPLHHLLREAPLRPHKIKDYLERRDPDFDRKRKAVLIIYREVEELMKPPPPPSGTPGTGTVSVDEKPGGQALATTRPDLPPGPGKHPEVGRDYAYQRLGTASILAALDLQAGPVTARGERRHRSAEFVGLLQDLDADYPTAVTMRVLRDHHSAHSSQATMAYLATRPNRFV